MVGDPGDEKSVNISPARNGLVAIENTTHSLVGTAALLLPWCLMVWVQQGAGVCFEELCRAGAKRIVRVQGLQPFVTAGSVVIARAAVREDGLSPKLVPVSYSAVATEALVSALRDAAASVSVKVHEGIVLTSDLFYPSEALGSDLPLWQRAGVTAVEMEVATHRMRITWC